MILLYVIADEDVVKVHVHTNDPGLAIQKALKYGALSNMKIDNMRLEHQEKAVQALRERSCTEKSGRRESCTACQGGRISGSFRR